MFRVSSAVLAPARAGVSTEKGPETSDWTTGRRRRSRAWVMFRSAFATCCSCWYVSRSRVLTAIAIFASGRGSTDAAGVGTVDVSAGRRYRAAGCSPSRNPRVRSPSVRPRCGRCQPAGTSPRCLTACSNRRHAARTPLGRTFDLIGPVAFLEQIKQPRSHQRRTMPCRQTQHADHAR